MVARLRPVLDRCRSVDNDAPGSDGDSGTVAQWHGMAQMAHLIRR
jgi:hypothetical protein